MKTIYKYRLEQLDDDQLSARFEVEVPKDYRLLHIGRNPWDDKDTHWYAWCEVDPDSVYKSVLVCYMFGTGWPMNISGGQLNHVISIVETPLSGIGIIARQSFTDVQETH